MGSSDQNWLVGMRCSRSMPKHEDCHQEAIKLFEQMEEHGHQPNDMTMLSMLKACGTGQQNIERLWMLRDRMRRAQPRENSLHVNTALIMTNGKLGRLAEARQVFDKMYQRDSASWNAMISA